MSFLPKLWKQLAEKKKNQPKHSDMKFKEVYEGYRMIPIQKLERKDANKPDQYNKGQNMWKEWRQDTKIYTYMENGLITNQCSNGFFSAFYQAYMNHGDIKIKPDEVWAAIMFWFTKYVNDNAEQLRHAFVRHKGKMTLLVETDDNKEDWVPFMNGVIHQIKKNTVENVVQKLECNFSTTGLFQRMFSTALIMNTCKQYFEYARGAGCGVVNIHMAGTLQDWQKLEQKLMNLKQFDINGELKKYVKGLQPVLEQFTETFKGNANVQFWNNLYFQRNEPYQHAYKPHHFINGWLIKFFTTDNQITRVKDFDQFSIDIKYIDLLTKQETFFKLNGGCKGYSCIDDHVFTPHYSFAVVLDEEKMNEYLKKKEKMKLKSKNFEQKRSRNKKDQKEILHLRKTKGIIKEKSFFKKNGSKK